ncbi:phage head closure protein [Sphingobacterium sp. UT-1RO-CII-1]|uniref:phage head closure protein n=1 Tax=Sphingobacterium sp. UT-1RO-CII-1 TaxID=2995225 RepID=UPI00227B1C6D|nr:phage head closure protein [Sphingobacterium sp. UT-1RO-CII-1]MCY4779494.1 phage head closure protein [Sphingobacterium sp. UT-1RO-CII-1]
MALNVGAGRRRERISIYKNEVVRDLGGGTTTKETLYWDTWAWVKEIKGTRVAETFQDSLKKVYSVLIRYRDDKELNNAMQVEIRGKKTTIENIDNVELQGKYIEIIVKVQ